MNLLNYSISQLLNYSKKNADQTSSNEGAPPGQKADAAQREG
jgi:hypothetical protein